MNTHDKIELPPLPPADRYFEFDSHRMKASIDIPYWGEKSLESYALAAIEADRKNTAELLKNPVHVHTNMCRGIIAPITFDQLAHVLGDEATKAWIADRKRRDISNATQACNMQSTEPVNKTDWNAELASWSDEDFVQVFHECPDLANRLRKILAEPVKRKRPYAQGTALGEFGVIPMCDQVDDEPVKVPNITTKSDTERERAEFEAWFQDERGQPARKADGTYSPFASGCWRAWQGRAALQSQDREDSERLEWLVENMCRVDIDEGHRGWFVLERDTTNYLVEDCKTFREAIDHARRAEGGNHE